MSDLKRKLKRKNRPQPEKVDESDVFLDTASQGAAWAAENWQPIAIGIALLALATAGAWGFEAYKQQRLLKEAGLLEAATDILNAEIDAESPDPSAEPPRFASEEERREEGILSLQSMLESVNPHAGSGAFGSLLLANALRDRGEGQAAESMYRELVENLSKTHPLYYVCVDAAVGLMLEREAVTEAIGLLNQALDVSDKPYYWADAQTLLARLLVQDNQFDQAEAALDRLAEENGLNRRSEAQREYVKYLLANRSAQKEASALPSLDSGVQTKQAAQPKTAEVAVQP